MLALGIGPLGQQWHVWLAGAAASLAFLVDFVRADRREVERFGEAYREYMRRVPGRDPFAGVWRTARRRTRHSNSMPDCVHVRARDGKARREISGRP